MKVKYTNKYVLDLKHLEDILYSKDYYGVGVHPYDTINVGIDMYCPDDKTKYLLIFSVSTDTAKEIKSFSRSLSMSDIFITFIDAPDMVNRYPEILNMNIRTFPFKNIYERASVILGGPSREYICSKHIVTMADITGKYKEHQICIDVEGITFLSMLKIKLFGVINKSRRRYTKSPKTKIIDSFYDLDL